MPTRPNTFKEAFSITTHENNDVIDEATFNYKDFQRFILRLKVKNRNVRNDEVGSPDLISFREYGSHKFWWLINFANGIIDPFTELTAGRNIVIPPRGVIDAYRQVRVKNNQRERSINLN